LWADIDVAVKNISDWKAQTAVADREFVKWRQERSYDISYWGVVSESHCGPRVMKYMGSKRWMLKNGLGDLIASEVRVPHDFSICSRAQRRSQHMLPSSIRFRFSLYLQTFSTVLANAVVGRESKINAEDLWQSGTPELENYAGQSAPFLAGSKSAIVKQHRLWSAERTWLITKAYGGHYFSANQSIWLDVLRQHSQSGTRKERLR